MNDIFQTSDDRSAVAVGKKVAADTAAEEATAEPIVIRKLDRLETTSPTSNPSGN